MQNIINVERGQYYKDKLYSSYNHHQQDYKDLNQGRLFRYIERGKMLIVSHREARPGQARPWWSWPLQIVRGWCWDLGLPSDCHTLDSLQSHSPPSQSERVRDKLVRNKSLPTCLQILSVLERNQRYSIQPGDLFCSWLKWVFLQSTHVLELMDIWCSVFCIYFGKL